MLRKLVLREGKNTATFSGMSSSVLRPWVCFLRKSTEFHDMQTECHRKNYTNLFITVLFISINTWSLAPKFSHLPITRPPTTFSPIPCSKMITPWFLFLLDNSLPDHLLAPTHSFPSLLISNWLPDRLIALPLFFEKFTCTPNLYTPDHLSITLVFCCLL